MLSYYKQKENREKCSEVGAEKLADDLVPWSEKLPESIRKPKKMMLLLNQWLTFFHVFVLTIHHTDGKKMKEICVILMVK